MNGWECDTSLETRLRLIELVKSSYTQKETIQFVKSEFPEYKWSIRYLQRRLAYFGIQRNDRAIEPKVLQDIVNEEVSGPGGLLGYRALHRKIRNVHNLRLPRNDVYLAMNLACPEKLEQMRLTKNRKKFQKRVYKSKGSNWTWSLDGHDKLSGRNKSEFPLGIHACIDSFSRKLMWLKVWPTNCNPELPAKLFFDAIIDCGYVPARTRSSALA